MSEALLFISQLVTLMNDVLCPCGSISISWIEPKDLLFGITLEQDNLSIDLLNEPFTIGW